jgi:hypothetical protein
MAYLGFLFRISVRAAEIRMNARKCPEGTFDVKGPLRIFKLCYLPTPFSWNVSINKMVDVAGS